jgi:hypothetical protein
MTDLLSQARFAVDNPDVLHTPAMYREIIAGLLAMIELRNK